MEGRKGEGRVGEEGEDGFQGLGRPGGGPVQVVASPRKKWRWSGWGGAPEGWETPKGGVPNKEKVGSPGTEGWGARRVAPRRVGGPKNSRGV